MTMIERNINGLAAASQRRHGGTFRLAALCGLLAVAGVMSAPVAMAHAGLETKTAPAGAFYKAVVKIPHGCNGSATTAVYVTIPTGIVSVKPMPKPGWTLSSARAAYPQPLEGYKGRPVTDGVVEIVWSGGRLLDEHYDEFVFQALVSTSIPAGTVLPVAVRQVCEVGEVAWREVAPPLAPGESPAKLAFPAPLLLVTPGTPSAPTAAASAPASGAPASEHHRH